MEVSRLIRKLREERFVKAIEIERISRSIAESRKNPDFYVSHATLADIESGSIPSIYKIFSLAACLRVPYEQLLLVFGVDPREVDQYTGAYDENRTDLEPVDLRASTKPFELHFDRRANLKETNLLEPHLLETALVPPSLRKRLDPSRFRYALVGLEDDSMRDVIAPGSLVEIDREQNQVKTFAWATLLQRPIYFVLHELGYSCCWCQQDGNELILLPHPASRYPVRRFRTPSQASVIGRVTHAWLALAPSQ
jgi:transcriptional regulator with XRE-family HTH domain